MDFNRTWKEARGGDGLIADLRKCNFVRKAILAFNYSITSTFDSTLTDRPALKVKVAQYYM